jgi:hypothetical protein
VYAISERTAGSKDKAREEQQQQRFQLCDVIEDFGVLIIVASLNVVGVSKYFEFTSSVQYYGIPCNTLRKPTNQCGARCVLMKTQATYSIVYIVDYYTLPYETI